MFREIYEGGFLVEQWDDDARVVNYFKNGQFDSSRPYTEAENAEADIRADAVNIGPRLKTTVAESIPALIASVDAVNVISAKANADIGPKDTKDLAREVRKVARQVIAIARLVSDALDSEDIGA